MKEGLKMVSFLVPIFFILIILGWLIHWPTLLTLILFPVIVLIYYRLAMREEGELEEIFGSEYVKYKEHTPRFFPHLRWGYYRGLIWNVTC